MKIHLLLMTNTKTFRIQLKKLLKNIKTNYKPVSVLPPVSKIFESYAEANMLIYKKQIISLFM